MYSVHDTEDDDITDDEVEEIIQDVTELIEELNAPKAKRTKGIVIPAGTHPLAAFMMAKNFCIGEVISLTMYSRRRIKEILSGDKVSHEEAQRIRLVTGVRLNDFIEAS